MKCRKQSSSYRCGWISGAVRRRGGPDCRSPSGWPLLTSASSKGSSARHTCCGLDYTRLKKRLGDTVDPRRKPPQAAFVELMAHPADLQECVIEFESAGKAKMRIQWKSSVPPDWKELLRAWREVEG